MKTVLEMNGGDGYTKMELNSMPLNCILKTVLRVHFIFYVLSLLKNKWINNYWRNSFWLAYSCTCPLCFEKAASCPLITWTSWMFLGTQPHPHFCFRLIPQSGNSADQEIFNTTHRDADLTSSCFGRITSESIAQVSSFPSWNKGMHWSRLKFSENIRKYWFPSSSKLVHKISGSAEAGAIENLVPRDLEIGQKNREAH